VPSERFFVAVKCVMLKKRSKINQEKKSSTGSKKQHCILAISCDVFFLLTVLGRKRTTLAV